MECRQSRIHGWAFAIFAIVLLAAGQLAGQTLGPKTLAGMKWRLIGPFRGGRVEAVTGVPGNPNLFYFGAVDGGVWKTTNAGITWHPIFDKEPIGSIGAIAVAPSDHNVIYVGTGEPCLRGDISYGNGVYKSLDGGKTWTHIGLDDTRHIAAVLVDPQNANVVFVAAIGHAYGPNAERGVFRSTDGGKTWQKVLYRDDQTGAVDVVFDPNNSHILYAALYQVVRKPWTFIGGGPGSGIYKSTDDGNTWKHLTGHGLPEGVLGRIGLAVSSDSSKVYALIEAEKGGLYVSDGGGDSWHFVNGDHRFRQRAWYFTHIYADPKNPDEVYILNTAVYRSTDDGRTFKSIGFGDSHDLWIDPTNTARMIWGSDQGTRISTNGGKDWTTSENQPTGQFYHVAVDNQFPYYVYGSQQDAGTVAIASRSYSGSIGLRNWYDVGGGESGFVIPYLPDPDIVYAGGYDGAVTRFNKRDHQVQDISPWPLNPMGHAAAGLKYRMQWTMPIAASPFDPQTNYVGAQVLFKTTNGGRSWSVISPDLTRNDKSKQQSAGGPITQDNTSVEYYDTIYAIAPSPLQRELIWVGSDDGLIHITRDGGAHWQDVTPHELPPWSKISLIDPSPFAAGTAYVAVNRHKNDDLAPYIYKTTDYGATWTKVTNGIPDGSYVHAVREDPKRQGLLFAGTETGVFVSFDDGANWQPLKLGLPVVSVRDLVVKGNDLAIATHGRGFWILDDITPIRQMTASVLDEPAHLFQPAPAYRLRGAGLFFGGRATVGANPPNGAIIDYQLQSAPSGDVTLEIMDSRGKLVRKYSSQKKKPAASAGFARFRPQAKPLPKTAGLNRFVWDLRYAPPSRVPGAISWGGAPIGPLAVPGRYEVRLSVSGKTYTAPLEVKEDPRAHATLSELQEQFELAMRIRDEVTRAHDAVNQIRGLHTQLTALSSRLSAAQDPSPLVTAVNNLDKKAGALEDQLIQPKSKSGEDPLNYPVELADQMMALQSTVESADTTPTTQSYTVFNLLSGRIDTVLASWQQLQKNDLAALNKQLSQAHVLVVGVVPASGQGAR